MSMLMSRCPALVSLSVCLHTFVCPSPHTQDEEAIPVELRTLPEYKELLELKRLKKQTLQEIHEDKVGVRHVGYKVTTLHGIKGFCMQLCPQCMSDNDITSVRGDILSVKRQSLCPVALLHQFYQFQGCDFSGLIQISGFSV